MSTLMPQAAKRRCAKCGHSWTTAYFGLTACANPVCGEKLLDCSSGMPHVCGEGHQYPHGGDCPTCHSKPNGQHA